MIIESLLALVQLLIFIPVITLSIELLSALLSKADLRHADCETFPYGRIIVLIPAHNEEIVIASTISAITTQLRSSDRVIVIADNCTDHTANTAQINGAEVILRTDPTRRGKGFALAYGIAHLVGLQPADILVLVDADCLPNEYAICSIANLAAATGLPSQGAYLVRPTMNEEISIKFLRFLWLLKNHVRPFGLKNLRLPCQIHGSGIAIPSTALRYAKFNNGHLAEDIKLGLDFALMGYFPIYCPKAVFTTVLAPSEGGRDFQRAKWQKGHLDLIRRYFFRLVGWGVITRSPRPIIMAADLSIPPLSLLIMITFGSLVFQALYFYIYSGSIPFLLSCLSSFLLLISLVASWLGFGRQILSFSDVLKLTPFLILKTFRNAKLSFRSNVSWSRSERSVDAPGGLYGGDCRESKNVVVPPNLQPQLPPRE